MILRELLHTESRPIVGYSLWGHPRPWESETKPSEPSPDPIELSKAALLAARKGGGHEAFAAIANLSPHSLRRILLTDAAKLAFWINVYNAGIQRELRRDAGPYQRRFRFFAQRGVTVAGKHLTFNAIEHGLLRRSMFGYSLGYVSNPVPNHFEKRFRLARRDPRVHFALNCGAASCPPIAVYARELIDEQLDIAAENYLLNECEYDSATDSVRVTRLFQWFRGDFGGRTGMLTMLRRFEVVPVDADPRIRYGKYDWTLALE